MSWFSMLSAIIFPNLGGFVGAFITKANIPVWYTKQLKKPGWRPPNWAFGPVWTYLYCTMGYASYRVWMAMGEPDVLEPAQFPVALKLFLLQLVLNWLWTPIFFGWKHLTMAVFEILLLDAAVGITLLAFWRVDGLAAGLLAPYLLWLCLATALTISIWKANPQWRFGHTSKTK